MKAAKTKALQKVFACGLSLAMAASFCSIGNIACAQAEGTASTPSAQSAIDAEAQTFSMNVARRFIKQGADRVIDNTTWAAAIALNDSGWGGAIDADAIIADLNSTGVDTLSVGQLGKYICILTAAGIDCTKVTVGSKPVNMVALMEAKVGDGSAVDEYSAVCIIPVYGNCGYTCSQSVALDAMIKLASAKTSSLFHGSRGNDYMSTAQGILALLPYTQNNNTAAQAVRTATNALLGAQKDDGSFPISYGGNGVDDTALCYTALSAAGYSDATMTKADGSTPISYLMSKANATGDDFAVSGNEALSASSALLAFAAHKTGGKVYCFYPTSRNVVISLSGTAFTYTGKAFTPAVKSVAARGVQLASSDYKVAYKNNVNAGMALVTITNMTINGENIPGTFATDFTINKAAQSFTVSKAAKKVTCPKGKKKLAKAKKTTKVAVKGAKGTVKYTKASGSKCLTVNAKTGKITVKKGTKKGAYSIKVKVKAGATANYKAATCTVKINVRVK